MVNWEVQAYYTVIGWLHDPEQDDQIPPDGSLLTPLGQQTFQSESVQLEGWAVDNESGIASAQFIANYQGNFVRQHHRRQKTKHN